VELPATQTESSRWVARGTGWEIQASELERYSSAILAELQRSGRGGTSNQLVELRVQLLNQMVFTRLTAARATAADRTRAQFESKAFVDGLQRSLGDTFPAKLAEVHLTEAEFRAQKLAEALTTAVTEREVQSTIHLPETDVRKYYDENPSRWEQPEQAHVIQLFLACVDPQGAPLPKETRELKRAEMEKLRAEVAAGADFSALIKSRSEDNSTRNSGGEYWFPRGQMPKEFEAAAFALRPGELSPIVTTDFGFHLLRGLPSKPASQIPFDSVRDDIRKLLIKKELELRIPEYAARLKREANVQLRQP
jgi:parvulin-like peptidyl-prolyl isomerase